MSENKIIRNSIEKIEPSEGAEERMYKNIMQKAAAEKAPKKSISLYRCASALAACFVVAAAAGIFITNQNDGSIADPSAEVTTAVSSETDDNVCIGNPFAEEFTLEDIREWGLDFAVPEGAEDISYMIFDSTLVRISFALNGSRYDYNVSTEDGDISGIYEDTAETRQLTESGGTLEITVSGYYKAFWDGEKYRYCLSGTDGTDISELTKTAEFLMKQAQ